MKYHLKQVIKGNEDCYIKEIRHYNRNIGKTAALARLSAKYRIPVIVPSKNWAELIERDIPMYIPKYFKKNKPTAYVANLPIGNLKQKIVLMEEGLEDKQIEIANRISNGRVVGYRNWG